MAELCATPAELKKIYKLDLDASASHKMVERRPRSQKRV